MVTGNTYRHPAVLAMMAATVGRISKGRLDFGIGGAWNEIEHEMYGIPLPAPKERIERLDEACQLIRQLWTESTVTYNGQYYQLRNARCEPKPAQHPYPPFVLGGGGEQRMLAVVACHAEVWNIIPRSVEEFSRKSARLDAYCHDIGRDPSTIHRSVQIPVDLDNVERVRWAMEGYMAAGATHCVLELSPPFFDGIVACLADRIVEPVHRATLTLGTRYTASGSLVQYH
jgi:alkanesulfonate monooxygenase SsuD/methylene tetrahydromethanopterin reductase-like flavin-dependent oxidoreductase (luciferase family)